jgi:hypothetical protein
LSTTSSTRPESMRSHSTHSDNPPAADMRNAAEIRKVGLRAASTELPAAHELRLSGGQGPKSGRLSIRFARPPFASSRVLRRALACLPDCYRRRSAVLLSVHGRPESCTSGGCWGSEPVRLRSCSARAAACRDSGVGSRECCALA